MTAPGSWPPPSPTAAGVNSAPTATPGFAPGACLPNEHLHHFDRDSLAALLAQNGFECVTPNWFEDAPSAREGRAEPGAYPRSFSLRKLTAQRARNVGAPGTAWLVMGLLVEGRDLVGRGYMATV
ncbi:hypothetical protein MPLSOD_40116 [Mesorhizobium sp. SOD10]|nr:hypothetical protein MPLSOD_40116 [Mesorhizobium sp. SOD10]